MLVPHDFRLVAGQKFPVTGDAGSFAIADGNGVPMNLTGYSATLKAREYPDALTALITLTSGSGITLGGTAGTVLITFTAVQTAAIGPGVFPYDLLLIPPSAGDAFVLLGGFLRVDQLISRA